MGQRFYDVVRPDGSTAKYASVTTLLAYLPKPGLAEWRDKTPDSGRIMRDRATIGSIIHWRIHRYLAKKHNLPMNPLSLDCTIITKEMKEAIDVIWTYFLDAEQELRLVPYYLEKQVVNHEYGYAGTLDFAGLVTDDRSITDFKTFRDLYGDHTVGAQLAAYKRACDYQADKLSVLKIHEDTGWNLIPVSEDWDTFKKAIEIYEKQKGVNK